MAKDQKAVPIDDYTYGLLQRIVKENKARTLADAIKVSASSLLGVPYKSKKEIELEQDMSNVLELGRKATKEE